MNNFIIGSGWFSDPKSITTLGKMSNDHQKSYGGIKSRDKNFSKYWLSHILEQSVLPKRIYILDADSPESIDENVINHKLIDISKQTQNFGHGVICEKYNTLCGWARGFIYGAVQAFLNDCDYVYIEQDLLIFGKKFIENMFNLLYQENKNIIYLDGDETCQKLQQSFVVVKKDFLPNLIIKLINDSNHSRAEELKHYELFKDDILWSPYKGGRQRKNLNKEFYCLQHMTEEEINEYQNNGKLFNHFNKKQVCLMFNGQVRTFEKVYSNIFQNLINSNKNYCFDIYFLIGKNEYTKKHNYLEQTDNLNKIISEKIKQFDKKQNFNIYIKDIDYPNYCNYGADYLYFKDSILYDLVNKIKKYDIYIRTRPDIIFDKELILDNLDFNNKIHIITSMNTFKCYCHNRDWNFMFITDLNGFKLCSSYYKLLEVEKNEFPDIIKFNNKGSWIYNIKKSLHIGEIKENQRKEVSAWQSFFENVKNKNYELIFDSGNCSLSIVRM